MWGGVVRERETFADGGECAVAEQVHLHKPDRLDRAHLELRDHDAFGRAFKRQVVCERTVPDHQAATVD